VDDNRGHRAVAGAIAFVVCFAIGTTLSVLFGLPSRVWVPAGLSTSTIVAAVVWLGKKSGSGQPRS
jgi:hypothetical protein